MRLKRPGRRWPCSAGWRYDCLAGQKLPMERLFLGAAKTVTPNANWQPQAELNLAAQQCLRNRFLVPTANPAKIAPLFPPLVVGSLFFCVRTFDVSFF